VVTADQAKLTTDQTDANGKAVTAQVSCQQAIAL